MCGPQMALAGASLAVGVAGAVSKYSAASQDASAQNAYDQSVANAALVDRNNKLNALTLRQTQEHDAASQALFDNEIRAVKARGTADASAADGGVSGNSVEAVARNVYAEQGRIDSATTRNEEMSADQLQSQKRSVQAEYQSRTNFAPIKQPSALGLGLEIAGAGVQSYDLYRRYADGPTAAPKV